MSHQRERVPDKGSGEPEDTWVLPAACDSGTVLGGAVVETCGRGDVLAPVRLMASGRGWDHAELKSAVSRIRVTLRFVTAPIDSVASGSLVGEQPNLFAGPCS